jgi:KUP system potassium uptake protein
MIITTMLLYKVLRLKWEHTPFGACIRIVPFFCLILAFYFANMLKVFEGGYVPLAIGLALYTLMATWKRGREILAKRLGETLVQPEVFFEREIEHFHGRRLPGQAVFLVRSSNLVPPALINNLKFNQVLHETVVLLSVKTLEVPVVPPEERVEVKNLGKGFYHVFASYGFMEDPNVPEVLQACAAHGLHVESSAASYYLSRETLISTPIPGMVAWREKLFAFMTRNAFRAAVFYKIPSDRVIELGMQLEI